MTLPEILSALGSDTEEVEDSEEDTFLLFSQSLPSKNLGFVDAQATTLELTVGGRALTIHQSPTLLSSNRDLGTTGAVVWQVSPIFADWIASENFLFESSILGQDSVILELGCGSSGVIALSVSPKVGYYLATDQSYVEKLLRRNLEENVFKPKQSQQSSKRGKGKLGSPSSNSSNIGTMALDWETSLVSDLTKHSKLENGVDVIIAADCIYNEALIEPLVGSCAEVCRLRSNAAEKPTVCIIAQQLRSPEIFEAWLSAFHSDFRVWRVPDHLLTEELRGNSGFVIHVGIVKHTSRKLISARQ